jgi:DNA-binding winged helix-turn-helix (wHTH) protein
MTLEPANDIPPSEVYEFGPFRFDATNASLSRSGQLVAVAPRALGILACLIRNRHRVVTKADVIADVWAGITVQDNNLSVQMTALRKALAGDDHHAYVETVPRRGYRFVGDVRLERPLDGKQGTPVESAAVVSHWPRHWRVIAGSGLAFILIAALALSLWRQRAPTHLQRMSSTRVLPNPAAYEAYVRGRHYWDQKGEANIQRAIQYFHAAAALDPSFVLPNATLAEVYGFIAMWHDSRLTPTEAYQQGKLYSELALAQDPMSVPAHVAAGQIAFLFEHDFAKANHEYQLALSLDPTYPPAHQRYAWFLLATGQSEESAREMEHVLSLNGTSSYAKAASALHLLCLGRFEDALRRIQATIASDPGYASAYGELARAYEATGDYGAALAVYEKSESESGATSIETIAARGHCLGVAGRRAEALAALRQLDALSRERYVSPFQFAIVQLGLGERQIALQEVLKAWDDRSLWLPGLRGDPRLEPIRSEPEFQRLVRAVVRTQPRPLADN